MKSLHQRSGDTKLAFFGISAYVGRIDSANRCGFWPDDPHAFNFDPGCLVAIDLSLTPSNAMEGKINWDQVIVEDHGVTTIGPNWPRPDVKPSLYVGAVYLEQQFLDSLRKMHKLPVPPQHSDAEPYEYQTVFHFDGDRKGMRYRGFHVELMHVTGSKAKVKVFAPGTERERPPHGPYDIDLGSEDIDPVDGMAGSGGNMSGPLYVSTAWMKNKPLDGPKLPVGSGL